MERQCRSDCSESCPTDGSPCSQGVRLPPGILERYDLNSETSDGSLVWIETDKNVTEASAKIISKSKELGGRTFGIMFGDGNKREHYSDAFAYGVDTIYHIRSNDLNVFDKDVYARSIYDTFKRTNPLFILLPSSKEGSELAVEVSRIANICLFEDCTDIRTSRGITEVKRSGEFRKVDCAPSSMAVTLVTDDLAIPDKEEGRKGSALNIPYTSK